MNPMDPKKEIMLALWFLLLVLLFGCAHAPALPPVTPAVVLQCEQPPVIVKPRLAIEQLDMADLKTLPREEAMRKALGAYTLSVGTLIEFNNYLLGILEGYRHE